MGQRIIPLVQCLPGLRPVEVGRPRPGSCARGNSWCAPADDLQDGEQVRVLADAELVAVAQVKKPDAPNGPGPGAGVWDK